jgi:hypothetical protein
MTPIGMRHLNASVTFPTWALQFGSAAILIFSLNWMLARRLVRRRFEQLGLERLPGGKHRGSLVVGLVALGIFLLAPICANEETNERWWAVGLGVALVLLLLVSLIRVVLALVRCAHDPKRLAPGQSAVAGVAALSLSVAVVAVGGVVAPILRAEEARLLERDEALRIDPATGFTALETRRVQTFLERLKG